MKSLERQQGTFGSIFLEVGYGSERTWKDIVGLTQEKPGNVHQVAFGAGDSEIMILTWRW